LLLYLPDGGIRLAGRRPGKQIDNMLATLIDEGGDRPVIQIIEPSPRESKTATGEVTDCRREIELTVEPRLHGVAVR